MSIVLLKIYTSLVDATNQINSIVGDLPPATPQQAVDIMDVAANVFSTVDVMRLAVIVYQKLNANIRTDPADLDLNLSFPLNLFPYGYSFVGSIRRALMGCAGGSTGGLNDIWVPPLGVGCRDSRDHRQ